MVNAEKGFTRTLVVPATYLLPFSFTFAPFYYHAGYCRERKSDEQTIVLERNPEIDKQFEIGRAFMYVI
ncbi:hypothetical protein HanRHA438_Chr02g0057511 [Helianthus annuus]|nr:hypothetical protein HanRHA438_Chr02g0057511 [Helianthus annuus]